MPDVVAAQGGRGRGRVLVETYRNTTEEITLVPVAPLTNIATALTLYPKLVDRVPEIVIMGEGTRSAT